MIELLTLIIAILLLYILVPIISIYAIIKTLIHHDRKELQVWFYSTARSIDLFGNVIGAGLFNDTLRKEDGYKFGRRGETISSVLGKNHRDRTLTSTGRILRKILDFIEKDHCLKSIDEDLHH